jgi:ribosomal protein S6--L-glutamate ligase
MINEAPVKKMKKKRLPKQIIGWEEWVSLDALGLPAIKAKSDTGARTASLHAFNIEPFEKDGRPHVRFDVHPLQKNTSLITTCEAPVAARRFVTSSNGEKERRYFIKTPITIGERTFETEVTLTSRHKMTFRMLLGSQTFRKGRFIVDPSLSFVFGKRSNPIDLYQESTAAS